MGFGLDIHSNLNDFDWGGKKLWWGPFFFSPFLISCWLGSNFLCATHIIPVKNEEGVVIMFILNFDYILNEASSDSLERLSQTSPSKADHCEYKDPFMYAFSPWTQYNSDHSDGCFHACPAPPSMCSGVVQVVPATRLLWQVDIISKIWPNYNCASVKMSWWTTGASLEGILFQKAVVKVQCNALQCSQICSSHFCVVLSRLLTYKAAACWTRGHLQIDCNWTKLLTSAVASWGMWWKHQGYVCRVCEQMSVCVQTRALWHHVWTCMLSLITYLWQIIAQAERAAPKWSGLYQSLTLPMWISGWASLQIWRHGPGLITRSVFPLLPQGLFGWFPITPWYLFGMLGTSAE